MKTFEQYINEARQNYIFGGTDDRNTEIKTDVTFAELKQGDNIYYWNKGFNRQFIYVHEIVSILKETFGGHDSYVFNLHKGEKLHVFGSSVNKTVAYDGYDVVKATNLDDIKKIIHDKFKMDADSLQLKYV